MDDTTLETLEYPAVLAELAGFASCPTGKDTALSLRPNADIQSVEESFLEVKELLTILQLSGKLSLAGVSNVAPILGRLDPAGSYLLPDELLSVRANIAASVGIKAFLSEDMRRVCPRISSMTTALSDQTRLVRELDRILNEKGEIKDSASPNLHRIRRELRSNRERAAKIIETAAQDTRYKDFLQDDYVSIRDDRFVLAVKAGMHTNVGGIIHGRSGSGATYFIEPTALVELNNGAAILKKDERLEEIEILKKLSVLVLAERPALLSDLRLLTALDFIQAKALFSIEIKAAIPHIRREKKGGEIKLKNARHPLLVLKELRGECSVTPVDILIGEGCNVLVISGANTGGKTVALKTLGLLTLMVSSGIPIPADDGSSAVLFTSIFSDIGDRQNIMASLSTFSAHVKRLCSFLEDAGAGSLVLIDEIGAGTDPSEGGALALAALERLRAKGAVAVITTHLNAIKARAQAHPSYMNASVEFDEQGLRPLYRLCYGVPGPSLGLSIARSLGLPEDIIESARKNLKGKEAAFMESVSLLEKERDEMRRLKDRLRLQEIGRDKALTKLKEFREAIKDKAKARIEKTVEKAKEEIHKLVEKHRGEKSAGRAAVRSVEVIGKKTIENLTPQTFEKYIPEAGDKVIITGTGAKGVVVKVDAGGEKAEMTVGSLKVSLPWDKIKKRGEDKKRVLAVETGAGGVSDAAAVLNIIGQRVEPAVSMLERFLDNAHSAGLQRVEIIHGMGTGALARAMDEYLPGCPYVKGFHRGDPDAGGAGVTIVEFK
ncbi:MAG: endonuclease MutS2 [Deltaproteobacteria bacterium]|nr:endonuclease MutS2 [Deltaproteobacteria bacterium]